MLHLQIINVSTRQGRVGRVIGQWFHEHAKQDGAFEVELIDLAEMNLPLFDEPRHPRLRQYEHEHTKQWSAMIARGDAYVFVTPEYNFSPPPSFTNAIDFLHHEWAYKPTAFVSYGGVSGGLRSVQMARLTVAAVRMMPIPEGVPIAEFTQFIDKTTGVFAATDGHRKAATLMLSELRKWAEALKGMRAPRDAAKS